MSFGQTFLHYKVAHHRIGGKLFRNHINFHHTHYAGDHLVSRTYLGSNEGNITPYFFIPIFLVGACAYFLLPLNLFVVIVITSAASFYAHVFFNREYHVEGSWLQRFTWFRRQQELHFVHHRHANSNFAIIHFFWDKMLGTLSNAGCGAIPSGRYEYTLDRGVGGVVGPCALRAKRSRPAPCVVVASALPCAPSLALTVREAET